MRGEFRPEGVRREWCDTDVLRQLRRRSLATLRREVEPVEPEALARFLPAWHGIPAAAARRRRRRRGARRCWPARRSSRRRSRPTCSPARVADYRPALLDELCTSGDVVWVGAGAIGSADGRVRLCFADQLPLLAPGLGGARIRPEGALHDAIRARCSAERGASFWNQLRAAAPGAADDELLAALWDLVWAGEVTNDSLAPLRAVTGRAGARGARAATSRPRPRPRPGRLNRIGPPAGAGRWSLVAPLLEPAPTPTEAAHATALQLVERHGVVTREAVLAEGVVGGYASVYGVLKVLEERGQVRRGYFVSGLGAAQFALPGAVDRLRQARERADDAIGTPAPSPRRSCSPPPIRPSRTAPRWPGRTRRAPGPHGRGARGAARRRAARLVRPPVAPPRHVPAHATTTARGPRRSPTWCAPAACARSRCARSTASRWRRRRPSPRSPPRPRPPASPTATAASTFQSR